MSARSAGRSANGGTTSNGTPGHGSRGSARGSRLMHLSRSHWSATSSGTTTHSYPSTTSARNTVLPTVSVSTVSSLAEESVMGGTSSNVPPPSTTASRRAAKVPGTSSVAICAPS